MAKTRSTTWLDAGEGVLISVVQEGPDNIKAAHRTEDGKIVDSSPAVQKLVDAAVAKMARAKAAAEKPTPTPAAGGAPAKEG